MATWYLQQDDTGEYGYELKDGKLFYVERDRGTNTTSEEEISFDEFIKHYGNETADPFPQIIAALKEL